MANIGEKARIGVLAVVLVTGSGVAAVQEVTGHEPQTVPMHTPRILPNDGSTYYCHVDAGGPNCVPVQSTPTTSTRR